MAFEVTERITTEAGSQLESTGLEVAPEAAEEPLSKPARTSTRPVLTRIK
jgi:hypothetical protein